MASFTQRFSGSLLLLILAFAYLSRMYQLHIPTGYMFDEVYHAATAKLIAHNDPRAFEWWNPPPEPDTAVDWLHPPLAKYMQAMGILAFGENSFGWRFSSVIFGTLSILMTYHLAQEVFKNKKISLLAAGLASLDGLLLVQSRIAMNDIHVTFFVLLTVFVYSKFRHSGNTLFFVLTGLFTGLAIATKWSGIFILAAILFFEFLRLLTNIVISKGKLFTKNYHYQHLIIDTSKWVIVLIALPTLVYLASYGMMFLQGKGWSHFVELHQQIWYYQTHLEATHPYQSKPWQWVLNLKPVWYHVNYQGQQRADIYAQGNTVIFWAGFLAATISLAVVAKLKLALIKKQQFKQLLFELNNSPHAFLLVSYLLLWIPWLFSPRIMFLYHYTPAVPFLCIFLAYWLQKSYNFSRLGKYLTWTILTLSLLHFVVWYPHWIDIPIDTSIKDGLYFYFTNWR